MIDLVFYLSLMTDRSLYLAEVSSKCEVAIGVVALLYSRVATLPANTINATTTIAVMPRATIARVVRLLFTIQTPD